MRVDIRWSTRPIAKKHLANIACSHHAISNEMSFSATIEYRIARTQWEQGSGFAYGVLKVPEKGIAVIEMWSI